MRNRAIILASLFIYAGCASGEQAAEDIQQSAGVGATIEVSDSTGAPLGTVHLVHSCQEEAVDHLARGLALVHNMTYEEAASNFARATEVDPTCAMGYWGQAMAYVHPLWSDPPSAERFQRGAALLEEARKNTENDHVRAYIDALAGYYEAGKGDSEKRNLEGFEKGWRAVHEQYPNDPEGAAFYALAQLGTADPSDKTFAKQRAAGQLAEQVLTENPDHPGAHHYIIHAYDNPALADAADEVAHSYSDVAPEVPHALHMPTHTFTRLGKWRESIDWNRRSADAALERPVGNAVSTHYFHALDYLAYAYLQIAQDGNAEAVLSEMRSVEPPYQSHIASAYTFAAVPARLALERQKWEEAASLQPRQPSEYPWANTVPAVEAITYFARAVGAARSGQLEQAREDLETLASIQERLAENSPYWATQVEIQRLSALAWTQLAEGSEDEALATMREAAELEASTEKHPVTPGEVLPARELLADMLLELGQPAEALRQYEIALERSPNRFNSLYGAGRAAELSGDAESALRYYQELVDITVDGKTDRERLRHARAYLS